MSDEQAMTTPATPATGEQAHPYYKVMVALTVLTMAEIAWVFLPHARFMLILGLSVMAAVKAALVGLYYMHLKYESKALWLVIAFPLLLVTVMVAGLLPDSIHYW